ncbi:hypothetical protein C8J57DRAFT_1389035 [Mycena rebaudengoi]|nr:hypothetical protein C8J57DRAFT_1389035 [Mycena rebaudengoi]
MLWTVILFFCSVAAAGNITAEPFNITAFSATTNGSIGNICAVQASNGDTRVLWQQFPSNDIMQLIVPGPFATSGSSRSLVVSLPGVNVLAGTPLACFVVGNYALQGYYYLAPDYTVSELYFNGKVHWGTGSACPDCIQNDGFIAASTAMYAMVLNANGGRRVGFLSSDQGAIVEADRAGAGLPYVLARLPPTTP